MGAFDTSLCAMGTVLSLILVRPFYLIRGNCHRGKENMNDIEVASLHS